MNSSPLISIITPVFNTEKYVEDTINSVLNQTYQNWELLLVDDCSSDNSFEIISNYGNSDPRIKLFKNKTNSKAFETRNVALRNAKGSFIAFLDSDDIWHQNKLEMQLEFMLANNYSFTYSAFSRFDYSPSDTEKVINVVDKVSYNYLICNSVIATSTVMLNKDVLGYFEMRNVYYDDFVLWLDLLKKTPYAFGLNVHLLYYRLSGNSLSANKFRSAKRVYHIFRNNLSLNFFESHFYFAKWVINTSFRYMFKY
jgi:teichuronic acid biosynthesis glycosyltransferase TuaG